MTLLHHIPNQAATWFLKTISSHKYEKRRIEYIINRLWYGIFHITCHMPYQPSTHISPWANMDVSGWYAMWYEKCHIIIYNYFVALQDIEPGQLLLFIQSFGIPVESMASLLSCLDKAVTLDLSLLEEAVEDKQYMAQLIEIQHMRGAKGGELFYKLLRQGDLSTNLSK